MSTHPALLSGARGRVAAVERSRAAGHAGSTRGQRRPTSGPADRLEQLSSRLDILIRDVRTGAHSHRETERMIEEGEAISAGIRAVFRRPAPAPVNPPLWQDGKGRAGW